MQTLWLNMAQCAWHIIVVVSFILFLWYDQTWNELSNRWQIQTKYWQLNISSLIFLSCRTDRGSRLVRTMALLGLWLEMNIFKHQQINRLWSLAVSYNKLLLSSFRPVGLHFETWIKNNMQKAQKLCSLRNMEMQN